jgi:hypothetical protein
MPRQWGRALARVALAVVFTGPVGALKEAADQTVELFWRDPAVDGDVAGEVLRSVGDAVDALARAEHLAAGAGERAVLDAEAAIAAHGLTAAELMAVSLDPARATEIVLTRATRLLAATPGDLAGRVVRAVYEALVAAAPTVPELAAAYQRTVLTRLTELRSLPADARRHVLHTTAFALLADPSRTWLADRYPTSALLRAEYGVVPFWGRAELVDDLTGWAELGPPVGVRLYTAAGGMGKTRLLIELCRRLRGAGWRAGFLRQDVTHVEAAHLTHLGRDVPGVLAVVDYCETRQQAVGRLVDAALRSGTNTRIVLLARAAADWWHQLRQLPDALGDFLNGPAVTVHSVPPLAPDPVRRKEVTDLARHTFAQVLGRAAPDDAGELSADAYDRVLFLHLRALAAVEGSAADDVRALLDFALRREQGFWDSGLRAADLPLLTGRPIRQAAALATLAGSAGDLDAATRLLARAPLLAGQPAASIGRVAELLHRVYPSEAWLSGVQPDLLGEHLVEQVIEDDPRLLAAVYGA